jgi:hypothetical protein
MKNLRIFLDLDDVIFNWHGAYAKYFNVPVPTAWDNSQEMLDRLNLPVKYKPDFQPKGFVSARGIPKSWTEASLKKNKIKGRSNVHQVNWGKSKLEVLKQLNCELFIDDKLETFLELNQNGIPCLLMDAPHNKNHKTEFRINTLNINKINKMYNKLISNYTV